MSRGLCWHDGKASMHTLINFFSRIKDMTPLLSSMHSKQATAIYGVNGAAKTMLAASAFAKMPEASVMLVTTDKDALETFRRDIQVLCPDRALFEWLPGETASFTAHAKSQELMARRAEILNRLAAAEPIVVLATAEAAAGLAPSPDSFRARRLEVPLGIEFDRDTLLRTLSDYGYERVDQVDGIGQFSARGGIVDVFAINLSMPVRIEFFGDSVDSLREFNPVTQRSLRNVELALVLPMHAADELGEHTLLSHMPDDAFVFIDESSRVAELTGMTDYNRILAGRKKTQHFIFLSGLPKFTGLDSDARQMGIAVRSVPPYHRQADFLLNDVNGWRERGYTTVFMMTGLQTAVGLRESLVKQGIGAEAATPDDPLTAQGTYVMAGSLSAGFELTEAKLVVITEREIKGRLKMRRRSAAGKGKRISDHSDLKAGDYVVHVGHGIGRYAGVETLEVAGNHRDYFHIRYADDDKLYVPVDQVQLLQKYIGSEGEAPRLSRLGGTDWARTKAKAKAAVTDLARELIELYARRSSTPGFAFAPDTPWQTEFEDAFQFEETPDQLTAAAEIKTDMEKPLPMDRLLCGDVGFGKTEVALRAAFKAVMSGKQVAVLVPTTVLAQQHFQTFSARFAAFGLTVDLLSRFRSPAEQRQTLKKTAEGKVDVLIGTHRILQPDVLFKDLGMLVVDEEQRFGVAQKERLKKWSAGLDVLTLTATPIPRTLHMSLAGLRDMSTIESAPEDRLPVQTYVVEYRQALIAQAIRQEIARGGQTYFVYNRVETIERMLMELQGLVPEGRFVVAHGQMHEDLLEDIMMDFYEGRYDVIVCTTIIENGLDVTNANTIIVYDADRFGLSQLYQMRGRVGRSDRLAHAYLTYRPQKVMSEIAEKRLRAISEFTELGAGFKIAMRDLEIRGAGNLLGSQQHGHIAGVGFEMYCRLLEEAVRELKEGPLSEPAPEPVLELAIDAYIPGEYVEDAMHKIELYSQVAAIRSEEQASEFLDEIIDRFGEPPEPLKNLLLVARIKNMARRMGARSVIQKGDLVEITFSEQPVVNLEALMELRSKNPNRIQIIPGPPQALRMKQGPQKQPLPDWLLAMLKRMLPEATP